MAKVRTVTETAKYTDEDISISFYVSNGLRAITSIDLEDRGRMQISHDAAMVDVLSSADRIELIRILKLIRDDAVLAKGFVDG